MVFSKNSYALNESSTDDDFSSPNGQGGVYNLGADLEDEPATNNNNSGLELEARTTSTSSSDPDDELDSKQANGHGSGLNSNEPPGIIDETDLGPDTGQETVVVITEKDLAKDRRPSQVSKSSKSSNKHRHHVATDLPHKHKHVHIDVDDSISGE